MTKSIDKGAIRRFKLSKTEKIVQKAEAQIVQLEKGETQ
jgi:hypothetical protein